MLRPQIRAIGFDFYGVIFQYDQDGMLGMLNLIRELRSGGYRVGLLSNVSSRGRAEFSGLEHHFDVVVVSGESGEIKPYPEIYQRFVQQLGAKPNETVFIDDNPRNVAGAEAAGLYGVHYLDMTQLQQALLRLGVRFA